MLIDAIRTLYAHSVWANERILAISAELGVEQLTAPASIGSSSLRDTIVHIMSAQNVWLARMRDGITPDALAPDEFGDVASIREHWMPLDHATYDFLDKLDDAALAELRVYTNTSGERHANSLWQMLMHQAYHAQQHRSEAALLLTTTGYSPGWLDLLYYTDWRHRA